MILPVYIMALTLYYEAAGESFAGKEAVASVIWNRSHGDVDAIEDVCLTPKQFSCWNPGGKALAAYAGETMPKGKAWADCKAIALRTIHGTFKPTGQWTHYHTTAVNPRWSRSMRDVQVIGHHKFGRIP